MGSVSHSSKLTAISWSQAGDALLCADAEGGLRLWGVHRPAEGPGEITERWAARSPGGRPHHLTAAGNTAGSPAASAAVGERHAVVWRLSSGAGAGTGANNARTGAAAAVAAAADALRPASPSGAAGAAAMTSARQTAILVHEKPASGRAPASAGPGAVAAVASAEPEVLRHPAGVEGLQWKPFPGGVLDGGAVSPTPPLDPHPALLTVAADGVVRVWVEVVLEPLLPARGAEGGSLSGSPKRPATPRAFTGAGCLG